MKILILIFLSFLFLNPSGLSAQILKRVKDKVVNKGKSEVSNAKYDAKTKARTGVRNELEGISDPAARKHRYDQLVEGAYQRGKAINYGVAFGVDDVIDPADSRRWVARALDSTLPLPARRGKKRRNIDTW